MEWFSGLDQDEQDRLRRLLDEPENADASKEAGDNIEYGCWLVATDELCWQQHRVSIFDLSDLPWPAWYDDGLTPAEVLVTALEEDGLGQ